MRTGRNGRTAITWKQTELDGLEAAPLAFLSVGASWSWRGQSLALSQGQAGHLSQTETLAAISLLSSRVEAAVEEFNTFDRSSVEFTNGARRYVADLIWIDGEDMPILLFENGCPARDEDFWVSNVSQAPVEKTAAPSEDNKIVSFPVQHDFIPRDANDLPLLVLTASE